MLFIIVVKITIMNIFFLFLLVLNSTLYTKSIFSSYIDVSIKASTWQPQELSYPHVIKVGGVNQPCVEKTITIRLQNFVILVITTPVKRHKNSFNLFSQYSNAP